MKLLKTYKGKPFSLAILMLTVLSAALSVAAMLFVVIYILYRGIPHISPSLFFPRYNSENLSMLPAVVNTALMTASALAVAVPIGVFSAVYLTEYASEKSFFVRLVRTAAESLASTPSIVFGLFGFLVFVSAFKWGYSFAAGALTLSMMILPIVLIASKEALLSVPKAYREGSLALGAGKVRTVFKVVLPSAVHGIVSSIILSVGRIVGESAALIFTSGTAAKIPKNPTDSARTLSVHMYCLLSEGLYTNEAFSTAVVLLGIAALITMLRYLRRKGLK